MNSAKIDNQLNLALDVNNTVREETIDLNVGYNKDFQTWELIVRYIGDLETIANEVGFSYVELMAQYAIITIREDLIDQLAKYTNIIFIEKPKRLSFEVDNGIPVSCISSLQTKQTNLTGRGVIVAIIDSGIDYFHPDFRTVNGKTRIIELWDQTIDGNPPPGYNIGSVYSREQIDEALSKSERFLGLEIVPSTDISGHGTHVAGIACGSGLASSAKYRGVAYESDILIVKLGSSVNNSFPNTAQLMQAINYCIQKAEELGQPIAINISFGNNYGSHTGQSLLENYINQVAAMWKTSIVIGTGNEGGARTHASGILTEQQEIELPVSNYQFTFNLQLWKNYYDQFNISIIDPTGKETGRISEFGGTERFTLGGTQLYVYYGEPQPINGQQEIYFEFVPVDDYVTSGIWQIRLTPTRIIRGNYDMWLPSGGVLNRDTGFLRPSESTTLTIPSTASYAISVGAYDALTDTYAYFSGRGYTRNDMIKPDLVAPGVNITSAAPNGGYTDRSGTSMATPFVTGSAALMLEWGIVKNNDPYLYGEKLKVYLISGARKLPIETTYPNPVLGYGALCLSNSIPE